MPRSLNVYRLLSAAVLVLLFAGCAQLPEDYPRQESYALVDYRSTSLGGHFAKGEDLNPGYSAFSIIRQGDHAFGARLALIDLAEKTLDLQVYIWEPDATGVIIAERLVAAADRGVRVRLLVDDLGFGGEDAGIASIDAHPNIEARLFNPFASRTFNVFDFMFDLGRVNHRMHNKILVADNSIAIVGGRNVGNHYFDIDPETNFRDLDIGGIGPVVREASEVFDHFWNTRAAVPVAALVDRAYTMEDLENTTTSIRERISLDDFPYQLQNDIAALREMMLSEWDLWTRARGNMVWNRPETIADDEKQGEIIVAMAKKFETVQHTLLIESAYFVVRDGGVEMLRGLVERGVKVRVLTNSLLSNDVLAAHAGHAKYRKKLLEAGVEIYELRSDSTIIDRNWRGESRAGLHTKALAFDDESIFIGSFNLDPRSANINTEAGIYLESPVLAADLTDYMDEGASLVNSYRVTLDEKGDLRWTTLIDGEEVVYDKDPLSTFGQRFMSGFIGILPIESQL